MYLTVVITAIGTGYQILRANDYIALFIIACMIYAMHHRIMGFITHFMCIINSIAVMLLISGPIGAPWFLFIFVYGLLLENSR